MNREDIEKLLGGFASDTLTAEERRQLFAAALDDQKLFDSLADEQVLREALSDDAIRRELLAAVRPASQTRSRSWMFSHAFQAAAACAGLAVVAVFVIRWSQPVPLKQEIAMVRTAETPVPPSLDIVEAPRAKPAARLDADSAKADALRESKAKANAAVTSQALADPVAVAPPAAPAPAPSTTPAPAEQSAALRAQQAPPMQQMAGSPSQVQLERAQAARGRLGSVSGFRAEPLDATAVSSVDQRPAALAIRLTRRTADGSELEIASGGTVDRSERVQLQLRAPETGQIQVIMHDSSGDRVIHAAPVNAGQLLAINVPLEGAAGSRELSMVIAREQRKDEQLTMVRDRRTILVRFAIR